MYFSLSTSKHLGLVVGALNLLLVHNVLSLNMTNTYLLHKCYVNQGKYKPGSEYEKDLTSLLYRFARIGTFELGHTLGSTNDAHAFLQCRGDSHGPVCRACFITAIAGLRKRCPRNKGGIIWYDLCYLEFSGVNTRDKIDYVNNFVMTNAKEVPNPEASFNLDWVTLLDNLTTIAIEKDDKDPTVLYAVGERRFGKKTLYGMVECPGDSSKKACPECYAHNLRTFYKYCNGKEGCRVLGRSCNFRFEFYPFVNSTADRKFLVA